MFGGPQAANVLGVTDPTDLFHTIGRALGVALPQALPAGWWPDAPVRRSSRRRDSLPGQG